MSETEDFPFTHNVNRDIWQYNRQSLIKLAHEKDISWQLTALPIGHTMPIKRHWLLHRQLQAMSSPEKDLKGGDNFLY